MAFDAGLAQRVRDCFRSPHFSAIIGEGRAALVDKRMFGGLCFMLADHMCCGIVGDTLMLRVGPDQYE